ncbi:MAG: hypothetical protein HGA49_10030 [Eubacteriaceae bacterium]|nr:hypothetical protein [Eubacteriaceae bacterium]
MKKKILIFTILIIGVVIALTGCIPGDGTYSSQNPAGFFWGIWHGWIAPVSLIIGLFDKSVRVYEVINSGWWYDFGFYIAIISGFGGLSLSRRKRTCKDKIKS